MMSLPRPAKVTGLVAKGEIIGAATIIGIRQVLLAAGPRRGRTLPALLQKVIMTMRLRISGWPSGQAPQRNNRHIPCICEHGGH